MNTNSVTLGPGDIGFPHGRFSNVDLRDDGEIIESMMSRGAEFDPFAPENIAYAIGEQYEGQTEWVDACNALDNGDATEFCCVVRAITERWCRESAKVRTTSQQG